MLRSFAFVAIIVVTWLPCESAWSAVISDPTSSMGPANVSTRRASLKTFGRIDRRLQELPRRVPDRIKKTVVPDLNPLIEQLLRHAELDSKATRIMPWVYSTCTELMVADYEDAITHLESAGAHLQLTMLHMLEKSHESIATDQSILHAKQEIDHAEFTILFLLELAASEL